ncbi:MAG: HAMP domain-containing sensor histidine kinase [Salibacteraceae bacterium]
MKNSINIYSNKQRWKLLLFGAALVFVGLSLWYTKTLVDKVAQEERTKVEIWAEAVKKRSSLVRYTSKLFDKLQQGERNKVKLYLEATRYVTRPDVSDLSFALNVLNDNTTVPVILTNEQGEITSHRNIEIPDSVDEERFLKRQIEDMAAQYDPIEIVYYGDSKVFLYYKDSRLFAELKKTFEDLQESFIAELMLNAATSPLILLDYTSGKVIEYGNVDPEVIADEKLLKEKLKQMLSQHKPLEVEINGRKALVYYQDSFILTQLTYYPFVQFGIIGLFVFIAYLLFSTARKAEQNQVWVGMSKETAHQLGTPLSSMIAWIELLREDEKNKQVADELMKDVERLQVVTDRFSKIGSQPRLEEQDLIPLLEDAVAYFKHRTGKNVKITSTFPIQPVMVTLNRSLFEWVIENLVKNALDAMEGRGSIHITVEDIGSKVYIEFTDTGKGIPANQFKSIFQPGYTSKKRGWGLGLSLSQRIIKEYHNGKIYVLKSELGVGTTFRITLIR